MVNFFFTFCAFFSFIHFKYKYIVRINFGANLDAQNAGNDISGIQISKIFWGSTPQTPPPIHVWYIDPPSNILSHRKVPFQKMPPPTGKSLKKALAFLHRNLWIKQSRASFVECSKLLKAIKVAEKVLKAFLKVIGRITK